MTPSPTFSPTPSPASPLRRRAALVTAAALAAALGLTACGSGDKGGGDRQGSAGDGGTHVVKTAMGDVQVKNAPQRVVVLDTAELDSALTLGVKPVGAAHSDVSTGFPSYLPKEKTEGIKDVGAMSTPNMEAIAALKPDLILTSKVRHGDKYAALKGIAPTVMTESTGAPWKENFQLHAEALGKQAEAKKVVDDYAARARGLAEAIGGAEKAAATKVNIVRFVEGADIRIYGKKNYIGTILADAGLGRPAITDQAPKGFSYDVSPEQIDKAEADVIFYATYGDAEKSKERRTTEGGLWKNLTAVKNGKAFKVDDELWIQGIGYTAASRILDDMRVKLTT
ncbi:ABC transporter substrate-binding protein [Streptomyces sp. URMC 123]|uniref:ABC transporter substrate-binding protein n=1 Tax=Streptomyces sp. URMC 123 TaxID=3423403 RepID=UPI003F1D7DCD